MNNETNPIEGLSPRDQQMLSVSRHLERAVNEKSSITDEEIAQALDRLNEPLVNENDEPYVSADIVSLTEEEENDESEAGLMDFLHRFKIAHRDELIPEHVLNVQNWKKIVDMSIRLVDSDREMSIRDIVPKEYKIYYVESDRFINAMIVDKDVSIYLIGGRITAPITVLSLLHEIGHGWDFANVEQGAATQIEGVENSRIAETLRKERVANAFALKAARSFTRQGDQLRKDAITWLKQIALHSYNLKAHEGIELQKRVAAASREAAKDYADLDSELEEQAIWDEFVAWRGTTEYQAWKQVDKYRDIEDYEEYGAWQSWCESNGRAWWKVIPEN